MQILDILAEAGEGRTLASLSKEMGTPKSSVLNLLRSLTASGHVDHIEGFYHLGGESYRLASAILSKRRFPEIARPTLKRLVDDIGETALIGVMSQEETALVYIDKIETRQSLRFAISIGDRRPLYCTAGGIILLAFQPESKTEDYIRDIKMEPLTPKSKATKKELRAAIEQARKDGYAINMDGATEGATGIAAPIFDSDGIVATLSVAAPSARISERIDELLQHTQAAALEISRLMGAPSDNA